MSRNKYTKASERFVKCAHCHAIFIATSDNQWYLWRQGEKVYHSPECRKAGKAETRKTLEERFWSRVRRLPNGCLECDFSERRNGYPVMWAEGRLRPVSHVAWFLHYGWWPPPGSTVDHICHDPKICDGGPNDPHRRCAEWSHLNLTTQAINKSSERSAAGRINAARQRSKTHCKHGHELTPENTYINPSSGKRHCRKCILDYHVQRRRRAAQISGPDRDPAP